MGSNQDGVRSVDWASDEYRGAWFVKAGSECKLLCIMRDHVTNEDVCRLIRQAFRDDYRPYNGNQGGHTVRSSGQAKMILQNTVKGKEKKKR